MASYVTLMMDLFCQLEDSHYQEVKTCITLFPEYPMVSIGLVVAEWHKILCTGHGRRGTHG